MHPPTAPRQLRLIIETDDFDEAVRFYRDVLGMTEQPAFATEGDDRVAILLAGSATIELASPSHAREIDRVEGASYRAGPRLALEVGDSAAAFAAAVEAGAEALAAPTLTPFQSVNARVAGPAGWQVTFFQELETLEARSGRSGFTTDDRRAR